MGNSINNTDTAKERWYKRCWRLRVCQLRYRFATLKDNVVYIPSVDETLNLVRMKNKWFKNIFKNPKIGDTLVFPDGSKRRITDHAPIMHCRSLSEYFIGIENAKFHLRFPKVKLIPWDGSSVFNGHPSKSI